MQSALPGAKGCFQRHSTRWKQFKMHQFLWRYVPRVSWALFTYTTFLLFYAEQEKQDHSLWDMSPCLLMFIRLFFCHWNASEREMAYHKVAFTSFTRYRIWWKLAKYRTFFVYVASKYSVPIIACCPLWLMPLWKRPLAVGERMFKWTADPPALSPNMVTLFLSPPNSSILFCTHLNNSRCGAGSTVTLSVIYTGRFSLIA